MRGYHTYKDIWAAVLGEESPYKREVDNRGDTFAVYVFGNQTFAVAVIAISVL